MYKIHKSINYVCLHYITIIHYKLICYVLLLLWIHSILRTYVIYIEQIQLVI